ncbi:phosphoglycerate kinase [bacterium]|nr:phosphoglycerate kinase [bacterium]
MNSIKRLTIGKADVVFLRVDFNVPVKDGIIKDTKRIDAALPTIKYLLEKDARVIVASHLGRPSGIGYEEEFSLKPVFEKLQEYLGSANVKYSKQVIGEDVNSLVSDLQSGQILLLENLRFHKAEKKGDAEFAKQLSALGAKFYVNDAFGTMHREHASVFTLPGLFPMENKAMGFLVEKEYMYLNEKLTTPERPYSVISGGAKVKDKIGLLETMIVQADHILIGGGMMFTFLKAKGYNVGKSLLEEESLDIASRIMERAGDKLVLPVDTLAVDSIESPKYKEIRDVIAMQDSDIGVDIGPRTCELFSGLIVKSGSVVFNGPMGIFEIDEYARGTVAVIDAMAECEGITVVGGGDSASSVKKFNKSDKMSHISTGGGASLEMLSGVNLPGFRALEE